MNPTLPDLRGFRPMCRYQARIGLEKTSMPPAVPNTQTLPVWLNSQPANVHRAQQIRCEARVTMTRSKRLGNQV
jgi:hypothetical protein